MHEDVAAAVNGAVALPCKYWLWVDVRRTREKPDRQPPPDVAKMGEEAAAWVKFVEPSSDPRDMPRERWVTDDGFAVTVTVLGRRDGNRVHYAPVANPTPRRMLT